MAQVINGERVRTLIQEQYGTFEAFSLATGIKDRTLTNYVNGHIKRPNMDVIEKMARALNVSVDEIRIGHTPNNDLPKTMADLTELERQLIADLREGSMERFLSLALQVRNVSRKQK